MEEIYAELIRLMELLDFNQEAMAQDDTTIPREIMHAFNSNNNYLVDVLLLEKMIKNTIATPDFIAGAEHIEPTDDDLHNARLQALRGNYLRYLQILRDFDMGHTLPDRSNV